jgi:hypothetical protein
METEMIVDTNESPKTETILTPEVTLSDDVLYLVRMNGEAITFVDCIERAKLVVDSFAAHEVKIMASDSTKVYRQDEQDGLRVVISTQSLGYVYNGPIVESTVIDFIAVKGAVVTKSRLGLPRTE